MSLASKRWWVYTTGVGCCYSRWQSRAISGDDLFLKKKVYLLQVESSSLALSQQSCQVLGLDDHDGQSGHQHQGGHHPHHLHLLSSSNPHSPPLTLVSHPWQEVLDRQCGKMWEQQWLDVQGNRSQIHNFEGHPAPTNIPRLWSCRWCKMSLMIDQVFLSIYMMNILQSQCETNLFFNSFCFPSRAFYFSQTFLFIWEILLRNRTISRSSTDQNQIACNNCERNALARFNLRYFEASEKLQGSKGLLVGYGIAAKE